MSDLNLSGYASLFGETDLSGDVVQRGAFAASLLSRGGKSLPMLLGHDPKREIGVWDRAIETPKGLWVQGRLFARSAPQAQLRLIRSGSLSGLSIGYKTRRFSRRSTGRLLSEIDLWEVSLVAFPMLPGARIETLTPISSLQNAVLPDAQRSA